MRQQDQARWTRPGLRAACGCAADAAVPAASSLGRRRALAQLGAMAAVGWLPPSGLAAAPPPVQPMQVRLPPLTLRQRRLANGLQQISLPSPRSPTVAVQLWYRVGGKDDPEGRSGFAHLFEHLMFKGTRHMPNEFFDRLTEDVGGQNNAYTAEDMTVYQNEVPSNHLERLLWAEAERMAHLRVDQANFDSERQVVVQELHERVQTDPYGRFYNDLPVHAFSQHPYRRPVIGNEAELMAATLDDVQRFHATYYRPDNAVLVVVGDFEPAQLDRWVDRYFGALSSPAQAVPRVAVAEPARSGHRRVQLFGPQVPLPALALLWAGPPAAHADAPALQVAQALLSLGDASRLNQALVYSTQLAQVAGFSAELFADAGMLVADAIAATGQPLRTLEARLLSELRRLAEGPLDSAELHKVRHQLLTHAVLGRQTPQGQAEALGRAVLLLGDARAADRQLQRLQAVAVADVRRVLKRWVLDAPRTSVVYQQAPA